MHSTLYDSACTNEIEQQIVEHMYRARPHSRGSVISDDVHRDTVLRVQSSTVSVPQ